MHLFKIAVLASLFVAVTSTEISSNCSSVTTVFVTETASPLTEKVSIPSEASPFNSSKHDVLPKLQLALDTSTNLTAASKDSITLIQVVTSIPPISTPATIEKGPYLFTADNGTTVWLGGKSPPTGVPYFTSTATIAIQLIAPISSILSGRTPQPTSYSVVFLTVASEVYETVTLTKTALAVTTSCATTVPSFAPVSSSNAESLTSTVRSAATAPLIALTPPKRFIGFGSNGWNATFRTRLLAGSANEPVKLFSQQTGLTENLVARPGIGSVLVGPSSLTNTTRDAAARRFGSTAVPTFENLVVWRTKTVDGTAVTTIAAMETPKNAAPHDPVVTTAKKITVSVYPWDLGSGSG